MSPRNNNTFFFTCGSFFLALEGKGRGEESKTYDKNRPSMTRRFLADHHNWIGSSLAYKQVSE